MIMVCCDWVRYWSKNVMVPQLWVKDLPKVSTVAAKVGLKSATLRTQGSELTSEPPHPMACVHVFTNFSLGFLSTKLSQIFGLLLLMLCQHQELDHAYDLRLRVLWKCENWRPVSAIAHFLLPDRGRGTTFQHSYALLCSALLCCAYSKQTISRSQIPDMWHDSCQGTLLTAHAVLQHCRNSRIHHHHWLVANIDSTVAYTGS